MKFKIAHYDETKSKRCGNVSKVLCREERKMKMTRTMKVKVRKTPKQNPKDIEIEDLKQSLHGLQQMVLGAFRKEEIFDYLIQDFEFEVEILGENIYTELDYAKNETNSYRLQKKEARERAAELKKEKLEWTKHLVALKKIRASKLFKKEI